MSEVWKPLEDIIRENMDRSEPPPGWLYEDALPDGYPYDEMFDESRVIWGVRMFPPMPFDPTMDDNPKPEVLGEC